MTDELNRRDFIKKAAAGAGVALAASPARVLGANDRIVVGVVGCGRQGRGDLEAFARQPEVEIAAVCDVYGPNLQKGLDAAQGKAKTYSDFRRLLEDKDIDVVVIGTPDHWHPLVMVEACKAGKDVYVEKPICHTIDEGLLMVHAARRHHRVVQVGTQQRSGKHFQEAVRLIRQGYIGKVSFVRTWNYANEYPKGIGDPPDSEPPSTLDWNFWLGPAPKVRYNVNRFGASLRRWSTFRYFWDYAGGFMTDWGVHLMDIVQWAMGVDGPKAITASGGKFYIQDNAQTPDTLQVTYEYPDFVAVYENRWDNANSMWGKGYGIEFHGTDATLFIDRSEFTVYPEKRREGEDEGKEVDRSPYMRMESVNNEHLDHVRNFLDCVKTRTRPISDIAIGQRSTATCLLGNIAYRTRERIVWDVESQQLKSGGDHAEALAVRHYRAPWTLEV